MRTKKILGLVLGLLLIGTVAFARAFDNFNLGSEPDGFRDIKWGTDISTLPDMEYVSTDSSYGVEIQIYKKKNDELKMGRATLEKINYGFWKDKKVLKFDYVNIYIEGYVNWVGLRDVLFKKFGQGYQANKHPEEYTWLGETTNVRLLGYNEHTKKGNLWIASTKINDQQEEYYDKQKEKGGAKDTYSFIKEPPIPVK